mmetsp:Transcript_14611/g.21545  ORF Transcript_14611/g.21545 Transcript_14611/m.21545 type:complete len:167 (-) Transcript_14611:131-631(-)
MYTDHQMLSEVSSSVVSPDVLYFGSVFKDTPVPPIECFQELREKEEEIALSDDDLENLFLPPPPDHGYWESDRFSEKDGNSDDSSSCCSCQTATTACSTTRRMSSETIYDEEDKEFRRIKEQLRKSGVSTAMGVKQFILGGEVINRIKQQTGARQSHYRSSYDMYI